MFFSFFSAIFHDFHDEHTKNTLYSHPHLEALNDFIDVLQRRPLPPDLEDPKNFKDPSLNKMQSESFKLTLLSYLVGK